MFFDLKLQKIVQIWRLIPDFIVFRFTSARKLTKMKIFVMQILMFLTIWAISLNDRSKKWANHFGLLHLDWFTEWFFIHKNLKNLEINICES